nr:hypothetical protein [Tanacetum cinerariifolium]
MVNTRTDAELAAAVQNALQILLPQIRAEIREEFCTAVVMCLTRLFPCIAECMAHRISKDVESDGRIYEETIGIIATFIPNLDHTEGDSSHQVAEPVAK